MGGVLGKSGGGVRSLPTNLSHTPYVSTTSQFNYDKIILDGVLLFFSSALVAAIAVEYFFSRRLLYGKQLAGLLFFLVPIIIIGTVAVLYALIYPTAPTDLGLRERIRWLQVVILAVSCLYAILIKSLTFFGERNVP